MRKFLEIKETLDGGIFNFTCMLLKSSSDEMVVLFRLNEDIQIEDLYLQAGTLSFGYFWPDRPYNAYHWVSQKGESLGVYFNISDRTEISDSQVYWRDLIVDVLVTPDGHYQVIDEDEVPDNLDAHIRRKINSALAELVSKYKVIHSKLVEEIPKLLPIANSS